MNALAKKTSYCKTFEKMTGWLNEEHGKEGPLLCFVKNPVADIGPYQLGLFVIFSHVSSKPLSLNPQQGRAQLANTGEKW